MLDGSYTSLPSFVGPLVGAAGRGQDIGSASLRKTQEPEAGAAPIGHRWVVLTGAIVGIALAVGAPSAGMWGYPV